MMYRFFVFVLGCFLLCGCYVLPVTEEGVTSKDSYVSMIATIDNTALLKTTCYDYDLQGTISFLDLLAKVKDLERECAVILSDGNDRFYWLTPDSKFQHDSSLNCLPKICSVNSLLNTRASGICLLIEKPKSQYSMSLAITILLWPWHIEDNEVVELKRSALETIALPFLYPHNAPLTDSLGRIVGVLLMDSFEDSLQYTGKEELTGIFENGLSSDEKAAIRLITQDSNWKIKVILALFNINVRI